MTEIVIFQWLALGTMLGIVIGFTVSDYMWLFRIKISAWFDQNKKLSNKTTKINHD